MTKNNVVKKQTKVSLNSSHFTKISSINKGIMTSYMHPNANLKNDVDQKLNSSAIIDTELFDLIKDIATDADPNKDYAKATNLMYLHKNDADADLDNVDASDTEIIESVGRYNAYLKLMTLVAEYYGPRCCFLEATCKATFDKNGNLVGLLRKNITIDKEGLINFVIGYFIKNYMKISVIKGSEDDVYYYDKSQNKMLIHNKKVIKRHLQHIVHRIYSGFRCEDNKIEKQVVDSVISYIPGANDDDMDLFSKYSINHPNLVWFENGIYDIDKNVMIEHSSKHYLQNHHDYELPYYKQVKNDNGNIEYKPNTINDIKAGCINTLKRLELLLGKNAEFFITLLGYGFYHSYDKWNVITFMYDPAGSSGKSAFIRMVVLPMFNNSNLSQVKLKDMSASSNKFALSEVAGKELNVVTEVDDSHFTAELLNNLKIASGGDISRVEGKFKSGRGVLLHSKLIFSTNKGLPQVSTSQQDGGVLRRITVLPVTGYKLSANEKSYYTAELFNKEKGYFALYCMNKFREHKENDSFADYDPQDPNKPLITNEIASLTRKFIDQDNRILQFFIYKSIEYLDGLNKRINTREEMRQELEDWLKFYHVPTMKDDFEKWYKSIEEYKNTNGLKKYFNQNMEQQFGSYGIDMSKRNRIRTENNNQIAVLQEKGVPAIIKRVMEYLNHEDYQDITDNDDSQQFASNVVNFGDTRD